MAEEEITVKPPAKTLVMSEEDNKKQVLRAVRQGMHVCP